VVMQDCPGGLKISGTTPGTSFTVPSTAPKPFDIDGDDKLDYKENKYVISDTTDPTKKIAVIQSAIGSSLACKTAIEGSYVAPTIYYCADDGTNSSCGTISDPKYTLKRSDRATSGLQPITGSIVDLQVAYEDTDDFWYGTSGCSGSGVGTSGKCSRNPFDPTKIKLVRLSVVTRSWEEDQNGVYGNRDRDQSRVNDPNYCRPAVENRTAATVGGSECGYIYRVYTVLVQPRSTGPLYAGN